MNYLYTFGRYWYTEAPRDFITEYYSGKITTDRKEVVIISDIVPDDINNGYIDMKYNFIVTKVNDKNISSLDDLIKLVEKTNDGFIVFEAKEGQKIIIDAQKTKSSNNTILQKYNIPKDRSDIYKK